MGDGYRIPRYDARCRMQSLGGLQPRSWWIPPYLSALL